MSNKLNIKEEMRSIDTKDRGWYDSLTEEEIIEFCRTKLTNYKVPKNISFREELPKSNVGKILRRLLK